MCFANHIIVGCSSLSYGTKFPNHHISNLKQHVLSESVFLRLHILFEIILEAI